MSLQPPSLGDLASMISGRDLLLPVERAWGNRCMAVRCDVGQYVVKFETANWSRAYLVQIAPNLVCSCRGYVSGQLQSHQGRGCRHIWAALEQEGLADLIGCGSVAALREGVDRDRPHWSSLPMDRPIMRVVRYSAEELIAALEEPELERAAAKRLVVHPEAGRDAWRALAARCDHGSLPGEVFWVMLLHEEARADRQVRTSLLDWHGLTAALPHLVSDMEDEELAAVCERAARRGDEAFLHTVGVCAELSERLTPRDLVPWLRHRDREIRAHALRLSGRAGKARRVDRGRDVERRSTARRDSGRPGGGR